MERREAPGSWPRHADGCCHPLALRARRAPQTIPLRKPPASGALRLPAFHRDLPPRLSTVTALEPHPLRTAESPASFHESELTRYIIEYDTIVNIKVTIANRGRSQATI